MTDELESSTECSPVQDISMLKEKGALSFALIPFMLKNIVWFILFLITLFFALIDKNMVSIQVLMNVLEHSSILGILVIGLTFCLITGHFDLSSESTLGFTALVGAWLVSPNSWASGWLLSSYSSSLIMLLIGLGIGWANSIFILNLKINAFIVTLAMLLALRGITLIWTHARSVFDLPYAFTAVGIFRLGVIPVSVIFFLTLFIIGQTILVYTKFGRDLYAIGGNRNAAYVAGVPVEKRIRATFLISGVLGAVSGLVLVGRLEAATSQLGAGMIFEVFAAAVIGGVSLQGGKGDLIGPLGGVLLLGVISTALSTLPISGYWVDAARGIVILAAVLLERLIQIFEEKHSYNK
jgi:ribose/xylose/arabinose/galactoside ABC-type transport system permease subunit